MLREWNDKIDITTIPDEAFWREAGRRNQLKRVNRTPGTGRPRSEDRCPCGMFTRARAEQRNHVCTAPVKRTRKAVAK